MLSIIVPIKGPGGGGFLIGKKKIENLVIAVKEFSEQTLQRWVCLTGWWCRVRVSLNSSMLESRLSTRYRLFGGLIFHAVMLLSWGDNGRVNDGGMIGRKMDSFSWRVAQWKRTTFINQAGLCYCLQKDSSATPISFSVLSCTWMCSLSLVWLCFECFLMPMSCLILVKASLLMPQGSCAKISCWSGMLSLQS